MGMSRRRPAPPLSSLRAFAAAARHESLRAAALDLGVTPSAISHQVRALEDWVGGALFVRATRQVRLTPTGRRLFRGLSRGFTTLDRALQEARAGTEHAVLRVSALPLFTATWLIPRLERFEAHSGGLEIAVDTSNRLADLEAGEADVAIRNIRHLDSRLVNRRLLDLRAVPLCTPDLAARIAGPRDLSKVTLIHISARPDGWSEWLAAGNFGAVKARAHLSFDTLPAALEAAAKGRGVILGLDPLIWDAPAAENLVVPPAMPSRSGGTYFVVHRKADRARRTVRLFCDWIAQEMQADMRRLQALSRKAMARSHAAPR
jgi:LysR family glycine cleavage system transcriptional activator